MESLLPEFRINPENFHPCAMCSVGSESPKLSPCIQRGLSRYLGCLELLLGAIG